MEKLIRLLVLGVSVAVGSEGFQSAQTAATTSTTRTTASPIFSPRRYIEPRLRKRLLYVARRLRRLTVVDLVLRLRRFLWGPTRSRLPAEHAARLSALRQLTTDDRKRAAKHGMPLDDRTLCRYLEAAGWSMNFGDRSVATAIADTVAWRERTPAARSPALNDDAVSVTRVVSPHGERVVSVRPARRSKAWWSENLVAAVELACRAAPNVCVVIDCGSSSGADLLEAAKRAAPTFPILSTHYPGRLGRVVVVNAAPGSRACWWFIRPLIDRNTRHKVFFLNDLQALKRNLGIDLVTGAHVV